MYDYCKLQTADCRLQTVDNNCFFSKIVLAQTAKEQLTTSRLQQRLSKWHGKLVVSLHCSLQMPYTNVKITRTIFFTFYTE